MQSGFPEKILTTNIVARYNRETIGDIKVEKNSVTLVEFFIRPSCCMMTSLWHNTIRKTIAVVSIYVSALNPIVFFGGRDR